MQHKKIASILAIAALSLSTPFFSMPSVNAFDDSVTFQGITGTVVANTLPFADRFYPADPTAAGREGSTINFNVRIVASSVTGQRNVTVGVKFDWMTSWVNASNANQASTLAVSKDQYVTVTVAVQLPSTAGYNLYLHTWDLQVWSDNLNSASALSCPSHPGGEPLAGCEDFAGVNFAIYSNDQADGISAREEATEKISALSFFGAGFPGGAKAAADLSQAEAERNLGDTFYGDGNFAAAKTRYQNALNLANSASNALAGGDAATYTNVLLGGIGIFLLGVGIFIAGLGGFLYFLRRRKAQ